MTGLTLKKNAHICSHLFGTAEVGSTHKLFEGPCFQMIQLHTLALKE